MNILDSMKYNIKNIKKKRDIRRIKKRIAEYEHSDLFYTHQVMDRDDLKAYDIENLDRVWWVDFNFIGTYGGEEVFLNTAMITSKMAYLDKIQGLAMARAYYKYPRAADHNFFDCMVKCKDRKGYYEYIDPNPDYTEKLYRYMAEQEIELLNSGMIYQCPWEIDFEYNYKFGVGFHVTVDVDSITSDFIEEFIREYNQYGDGGIIARRDMTYKTYTADDLGVYLEDDRKFLSWKE